MSSQGPVLSGHQKLVAEKLAEEEAERKVKGEAKKEKHLVFIFYLTLTLFTYQKKKKNIITLFVHSLCNWVALLAFLCLIHILILPLTQQPEKKKISIVLFHLGFKNIISFFGMLFILASLAGVVFLACFLVFLSFLVLDGAQLDCFLCILAHA